MVWQFLRIGIENQMVFVQVFPDRWNHLASRPSAEQLKNMFQFDSANWRAQVYEPIKRLGAIQTTCQLKIVLYEKIRCLLSRTLG